MQTVISPSHALATSKHFVFCLISIKLCHTHTHTEDYHRVHSWFEPSFKFAALPPPPFFSLCSGMFLCPFSP
ncbi:hypothetical protein RIF29_40631 [Crotalaria pallida]|uniref:Uncharacterized protein n=1 Tax=Crotalaria pallida TaxID=3830 RepID=A0AAN9E486_CROPI